MTGRGRRRVGRDSTPFGEGRTLSRLRVDPVACDGVGICSHLAPNLITVDAWGYPILARTLLDGAGTRPAERAVAACPRGALFLQPVPVQDVVAPDRHPETGAAH